MLRRTASVLRVLVVRGRLERGYTICRLHGVIRGIVVLSGPPRNLSARILSVEVVSLGGGGGRQVGNADDVVVDGGNDYSNGGRPGAISHAAIDFVLDSLGAANHGGEVVGFTDGTH